MKMDSLFGIVMFICIVPVLLVNFFFLYPKKWKERKQVLGVNRRKEFMEEGTVEKVSEIASTARSRAVIITVVCVIIAALLMLIKGITLQTLVWVCFIYAALIIDMVPYVIGHSQMMSLKRELGLTKEKGVSYVDLTNAGKIHALKMSSVLVPNILGLLEVIVVFLADIGVFAVSVYKPAGFLGTFIIGTFWLMGILITVFGYIMDNLKSEVISHDSDVNANYNRAKKMNRANLFLAFLWLNVIYTVVTGGLFLFRYTDMSIMITMTAYMILIMVGTAVFVFLDKKIEARYHKEMEITSDDDEYWILGMIYYNPNDKRLNVEKRVGVGGTINLAHPAGKVIGLILILSLVFTVMSVVWMGMVEATPIKLTAEDGKLICHQLRDEYVIPLEEIESIEYGDDISSLRVVRTSGVGMENLLKGNFSVDDINGCKLFLNPLGKEYIKIVTKSGTQYYVSGSSAEETRAVYNKLK